MNTQVQIPEENNQPQKSKLQEELEALRAERDKHDAELLKGAIDYHSKGLPQTPAELAEYAVADSVPGIWRGNPQNQAGFSTDTRPVVVQINGHYIPGLEMPDGKIDLLTDGITRDADKARESAEIYNRNLSYSGGELDLPPHEPSEDKQPMEFEPIQIEAEHEIEETRPEPDHSRDAEAEWLNNGADSELQPPGAEKGARLSAEEMAEYADLFAPGADLEPIPSQPQYLGGDDNQAVREFEQIEPAHGPDDFGRDYGPTDLEDFNREGPDNDGDDGGYDID